METQDFSMLQSPKLSPSDITKKINRKITIMGITPEVWGWTIMKTATMVFLLIAFSMVFQGLGMFTGLKFIETTGAWASILSFILIIPALIFNVKLLKRVNKRFGENTAFLVLSQHSLYSIFFNKKIGLRNYDFNPEPNNNFKRIG
jgi:predicted Abi (CAAX) family protease